MNKNIEKLQAATALIAFDNTLRSVANTVVYYGAVFAVIGIIFTIGHRVVSSWLALAIGAALLVESFYIRRTRSARALWVSGMTFAVFAVWFLGSFVVGLAKNDSSLGKGVIAGIFLAIGAWNILRSYSAYKTLLEIADPAVSKYVRDTLEQMRTTTLSEHPQIVEFKKRGLEKRERGVCSVMVIFSWFPDSQTRLLGWAADLSRPFTSHGTMFRSILRATVGWVKM